MSNLEAISVKSLISRKLNHGSIKIKSYLEHTRSGQPFLAYYLELYSSILGSYAFIESIDNTNDTTNLDLIMSTNGVNTTVCVVCVVNMADPDFANTLTSNITKLYSDKINKPGALFT